VVLSFTQIEYGCLCAIFLGFLYILLQNPGVGGKILVSHRQVENLLYPRDTVPYVAYGFGCAPAFLCYAY